MRIAKLHMDSQDKTRFEILGKSSVKYHLKANHVVEAKRWFWALNNAIQWAKDEAKEEEKRRTRDAEVLRQAKVDQIEGRASETQAESSASTSSKLNTRGLAPPTIVKSNTSFSRISTQTSRTAAESSPVDEDGSGYGSYDPSIAPNEMNRVVSHITSGLDGDGDYDDYGDDASSHDVQPANKDAFNITAQSAKLQLDLLASVSSSLQAEKSKSPDLAISDPAVDRALAAYESAVSSLNGLLADLLKISRDRDAYWQYRLDKEADTRKMWEESMARIVREHEELQAKIGESEEKRKRTKRALKEVLENASAGNSRPLSRRLSHVQIDETIESLKNTVDDAAGEDVGKVSKARLPAQQLESSRLHENTASSLKGHDISEYAAQLAESESDDEEFYDAIDSGEIAVEELATSEIFAEKPSLDDVNADLRSAKQSEIVPSFTGYEEPPRDKLKLEVDNRPRISLWVSSEEA
jgi:hypothetical protein